MVKFVLLHLQSVLMASRVKLIDEIEHLEVDLGEFFSLPIPQRVWLETRHLRPEELRREIDGLVAQS